MSEVVPHGRSPIELGTLIGSQYSNHLVLVEVDLVVRDLATPAPRRHHHHQLDGKQVDGRTNL